MPSSQNIALKQSQLALPTVKVSKVRSQESSRPLHDVVAEPEPGPVGEALDDVGNSAPIIIALLSRDPDIIDRARAQGLPR